MEHKSASFSQLVPILLASAVVGLSGVNANGALQHSTKPSPLFAALGSHNSAEFKRLLDAGADPNARTSSGDTVLVEACARGDVLAVSLLLRRKADVAAQARGMTPLLVACLMPRKPIVKMLLEHGAKPDQADEMGLTPLLSTLISTDLDLGIVVLLIEHGANVNHVQQGGNTPLMAAANSRNTHAAEAVRILILRGAKVNALSRNGYTALFAAASRGNASVAGVLLRAGARTDIKDEKGGTAAERAMHFKHPDVAKLINSWKPNRVRNSQHRDR